MPDLKAEAARHSIVRDQLLARFPSLAEDEKALADTLEGVSSFNEAVAAVLRSLDDDLMLVAGIDARVTELEQRKTRIGVRALAKREAILAAMQEAGERKVELPEGTLSVSRGPAKVIVTDEAEVPDAYKRTTVTVDKAALKKALVEGRTVPGAVLSNGGATLTIRRG